MFLQARNGRPTVASHFHLGERPLMTARSIRRAAERKAKKAAEKEARLQPTETEPISEPRVAANRANAQLPTGPRSTAGKAVSSMNAVKTGLTGRTVLLPSDDAEAYERHLVAYEAEFQPVGLRERELVQSLADIQWRLQRIPGLEMAIYARGREEFAEKFEEQDPAVRSARIDLETFLQYQKPLRNLQIQEGRLQRQREKDMAELRELQEERRATVQPETETAAVPFTDPDTLASFFQLHSALQNRDRKEAAAPHSEPQP
jgi:hypothetical protein